MAKLERAGGIKPVLMRWICSGGGAGRKASHLRRAIKGGVASALAVVGLVAFATPAFAHDNIVSATASCAVPAGSGYTIVWTIQNDYNESETGSVTSVTGGLSTLSSRTYSIAASPGQPYSSTTVTQTLPPSASGPITIDISSSWSDSFSTTDVGSYDLSQLHCVAPTQTIAGHIYLCNNGNPTTTEESGGTLGASGPTPVSATPNPLAPTEVGAGVYTMTATAPSGYQLVVCGGSSTPGASGSTATESVTVPSGGAGVGIFYVAPLSQTIAGHIYLCNNGNPTTTEESGGTLGASGPTPVSATPNPLAPTEVGAGVYTMTATAPSGYQLVVCGGSSTPGASGSTATESVTVPSGGAGVGIFYVAPLSQTIAGHIYLCNNGNPTTTEESGGTLGASGPTPVSATPNPLAPTEVGAGVYTMTATAPSGYQLVVCGGSSTPGASGSTATKSVTVPSGGAGVGIFYVVATPNVVTSPTTTSAGSGSSGSSGGSSPTTSASTTSATPSSVTTSPSSVTTSPLASTGSPLSWEWFIGLILVLLGSALLVLGRWQRGVSGAVCLGVARSPQCRLGFTTAARDDPTEPAKLGATARWTIRNSPRSNSRRSNSRRRPRSR